MRNVRKTAFVGVLVVGATILSSCSSAKESAETTTTCSREAGMDALRRPLEGAAYVRSYANGGSNTTLDGDVSGEVLVEMWRDKDGNEKVVATSLGTIVGGAAVVDDQGYALLPEGSIDGVEDGEWVKVSADEFQFDGVPNLSDTGISTTVDEATPLGLVGADTAEIESFDANKGGCEYKLIDSSSEEASGEGWRVIARTDEANRVVLVEKKYGDGMTIEVELSYDEKSVSKPERVSSLSEAEVFDLLMNTSSQSSVVALAQSFDRQLRMMASYGDTVFNNPNDIDSRKPGLLLEMLQKGDIPGQFIPSSQLQKNDVRILVWQPGGESAAAKWTRLVCPSGSAGACEAVDSSSNSLSLNSGKAGAITFVAGHLMNPTLPNPAGYPDPYEICVQFRKGGMNAFMALSGSANTPGVISTDIATACPAAAYGGAGVSAPVASTGEYTDLSATAAAGAAVLDSTW